MDSGHAVLELLHRDRPGVALAITVDGRPLAVVGGSDGWRTERIALPDGEGGETTEGGETPPLRGPITVEIRNQGDQFARLGYLMLTADTQAVTP